MSQDGYIYILSNRFMPSVYKIGKTRNDPEDRAKELSRHSGIPAPFVVEFKGYVPDAVEAEIIIHSSLSNHRVELDREFFKVSLGNAIDLCKRVAKRITEDPQFFTRRFPNFAKEWSASDKKLLSELVSQSVSFKECARRLGRTPFECEKMANQKKFLSSYSKSSRSESFSTSTTRFSSNETYIEKHTLRPPNKTKHHNQSQKPHRNKEKKNTRQHSQKMGGIEAEIASLLTDPWLYHGEIAVLNNILNQLRKMGKISDNQLTLVHKIYWRVNVRKYRPPPFFPGGGPGTGKRR
jgi:hypothetical protein